jgi:hypothetical protein
VQAGIGCMMCRVSLHFGDIVENGGCWGSRVLYSYIVSLNLD